MQLSTTVLSLLSCLFLNTKFAISQTKTTEQNLNSNSTQPTTLPAKKVKAPPIETSQGLKVFYGSAPWNKDSTQIENAELFVRDANSGRILKILLEETEPDSSTFAGEFSVGWAKGQDLNIEVYIPPEKVRGNESGLNQFTNLIRNKKVGRKPIVFKKDKEQRQILDVYDTKEQAELAFKAYLEKVRQEEVKKQLSQPAVQAVQAIKQADQEAAALAARQAKLAELAAQAASREEERIRKEQLERQKAEERIQQQLKMQAEEVRKRKLMAAKIAEQAIELYKQGNFLKAEELFKNSVELDPEQKSHYFRYGVCLYRNEKYEEALVYLKIAEVDESSTIEKNYYMGLIHFRLKELDPAIDKFSQVRNSKHEIMGPSAAFYEGMIQYTNEKFEEAKLAFEYVLDNSKDPRLDEKAEEYIERIANALAFKKKQDHRHDFTLTLGTNYDSNILFYPDNQAAQGSPTDIGGLRILETLNYQYRAIYQREFDWTLSLTQLYLYSFNQDLQTADPMIANIKSPLNWKGVIGQKGYKFSISPGYEFFFMDTDPDEGQNPPATNILRSVLLDLEFTLIMSDKWFSTYILENRLDDASEVNDSGEDNADATLTTLRTNQTFFLDKSKKKAFQAGGGYTLNTAKGDNRFYNKALLNFSYMQPFKKWEEAIWNVRLDMFYLDFNKSATDRADTNYSLTYSVTKPQNEWLIWGGSLNYIANNSIEANQYTKYSAMLTATFDIDEWVKKK
jgi:hypothetical protein